MAQLWPSRSKRGKRPQSCSLACTCAPWPAHVPRGLRVCSWPAWCSVTCVCAPWPARVLHDLHVCFVACTCAPWPARALRGLHVLHMYILDTCTILYIKTWNCLWNPNSCISLKGKPGSEQKVERKRVFCLFFVKESENTCLWLRILFCYPAFFFISAVTSQTPEHAVAIRSACF